MFITVLRACLAIIHICACMPRLATACLKIDRAWLAMASIFKPAGPRIGAHRCGMHPSLSRPARALARIESACIRLWHGIRTLQCAPVGEISQVKLIHFLGWFLKMILTQFLSLTVLRVMSMCTDKAHVSATFGKKHSLLLVLRASFHQLGNWGSGVWTFKTPATSRWVFMGPTPAPDSSALSVP